MSENTQNSDNINILDQVEIKNIVQVVLVPILMLVVVYFAGADFKEIDNFKAEDLFLPGLYSFSISAMALFFLQLIKNDGWIYFAVNELYVFSYSLVVTISISYFWVEKEFCMLAAAIILVLLAILIRFPVENTKIGKMIDKRYKINKGFICFLLFIMFVFINILWFS